MSIGESTKATTPPGATGGSVAAKAAEETNLWLRGPARHATTIACALLIVGSWVLLLRSLQGPAPVELRAHLRPAGAPVAVYSSDIGTDRVHWLKPGEVVIVEPPAPGGRVAVYFDVDGVTTAGFVDGADFDAEDLSRARAAHQGAGR